VDRSPGRYNLQRLGWKAFEDLVVEINRTILGPTVTPFRVGADGGRDGFFQGTVADDYMTIAPDAKTLVFQCKHTSTPGDSLVASLLSDEVPKIAKLAASGEADLFVVFSNRRVSAENDLVIREKFEAIPGVMRCAVLGEEWIESHIDGSYKLLRRVPRLYGVGDLSQILSHSVSKQTKLILDEMKHEQAVFVPTPSYRAAVDAVERHGIVVLVGPPASGKSAIATNLCMVLGAEDSDLEVLRIESSEQFVATWSAEDRKKLYWIEDVFGATTLDEARTREWESVFEKMMIAHRAGNRFIFTCRDYILKAAHTLVRKSKIQVFDESSVYVQVADIDPAVRSRILYNHIKLGDLPLAIRRALKPHLEMIAGLDGFTPEIARRLGTHRFHGNLKYDHAGLTEFVLRPVEFFSEVVHDLSHSEKSVIAYLLLSGNELPDPVVAVPDELHSAYGATPAEIRTALANLRGSLTKLSVVGTKRVWQVHHPSMIDAMQEHLRDNPTMLDLFVSGAPVEVLVRDCSTVEHPHTAFVPDSLYEKLASRLASTRGVSGICGYLVGQCAPFLRAVVDNHPDWLAAQMASDIVAFGRHRGVRLLEKLDSYGIGFDLGKEAVLSGLSDAVWVHACTDALGEPYPDMLGKDASRSVLLAGMTEAYDTFQWFAEAAAESARSSHSISGWSDDVGAFQKNIVWAAESLLLPDELAELCAELEHRLAAFSEKLNEIEGDLESYIDSKYDEWKDSRYDIDDVISESIFSDVDE
jgi:hypothetical protein